MRMDTDLIKVTIEHYGKNIQSVVCMEECYALASDMLIIKEDK